MAIKVGAAWRRMSRWFGRGEITPPEPTYLLLETGDYLLLETGDKILKEF